jgi:hypothetical protein
MAVGRRPRPAPVTARPVAAVFRATGTSATPPGTALADRDHLAQVLVEALEDIAPAGLDSSRPDRAQGRPGGLGRRRPPRPPGHNEVRNDPGRQATLQWSNLPRCPSDLRPWAKTAPKAYK